MSEQVLGGPPLRQRPLITKGNSPDHPSHPTIYPTERRRETPTATSEAFAEAAAIYAAIERLPRCPWNPFPANSPWGRQIDEEYRLELAGERIARRIRSVSLPSLSEGAVR